MTPDDIKVHLLLSVRRTLLEWKSKKDELTAEVVFADDPPSDSELRIPIPLARALEHLDAAVKGYERRLAVLGVEFSDED
jgi:hypothetical protein